MGGGNKETSAARSNYNTALTAAEAESPYDKRRREMNDSILDWGKSGDYRQPPDEAKVFFNFADPAERKRQRDVLNNTRGQGVSALGAGANPTLLALNKQEMDAQQEEDAARNYQDTTARLVGGAAADNADMAGADTAKRMGVLNSTAGTYGQIYQANAQRPRWWQSLLGGAAQVGSAYIGNPSAFKGFKKGGRYDDELGRPVLVGEEGKELALADDGSTQVLGAQGPQVVVPQKPGVVVPAKQTQQILDEEGAARAHEWLLSLVANRKSRGAAGRSPAAAQMVDPSEDSAGSQALAGDAQTPAVRPRRAVTVRPDEARAALRPWMSDPNAPVENTPSPALAAEPSPRPLMPYVNTPAELVQVSDKVPMVGRPSARNMPAPGEESANDASVRERLSHYPTAPGPGEELPPGYDGEATATRKRWVSPINQESEHNASEHEAERNPEERHGWKRVVPLAIRGFLAGASGGSPLAGVGGAITGAVTGAVDSRAASRVAHAGEAASSDARLAQLRGQRKDDLAAAQTEAQTEWYKQRPDIERQKLDAQGLQRERQNVLAQVRARKGTAFKPDDPLLAQAEKLGMHFDAEALNNAASNVVSVTLVDPDHPEQLRRATLNKISGEITDVGRSGYVQPVGPDGLTESQRRGDADRDRGFNALEQQRSVTNELQRAGLNLSRERFDFSKVLRDDRLTESTRKEVGAAAKLRADAEQQQMDAEAFKGAGMYTGDDGQQHQAKWAAQKWKAAEDKAEALRREYFSSYGYLHAPDGGEIKMTTDEFRQLFPNAPNPTASAPSYGVVLTDSTQPGTPHTNTYPPHRPAPRAPSSASPSSAAPAQPRGRVSRANFDKVRAQNPSLQGKSDAEVEAALRAQGIDVY
jgi:hypothetical protein